MKRLLLLLVFFVGNFVFAQGNYQPGYYLTQNSEKIEGLIKNDDWARSPSSFLFKANQESDVVEVNTETIKELRIYETSHFYKKIEVDAYTDYSDLGAEIQNPSKTEFARLVMSGAASLYVIKISGENKYIIDIEEQSPKMLVYKKYTGDDRRIREKKDFQRVMYESLQCEESTELKQFLELNYKLSDILKQVKKYNDCKGVENINYNSQRTKGSFSFKILPAVSFNNYSNASFEYVFSGGAPPSGGQGTFSAENEVSFDLGSQVTFNLGVEFGYVLPVNNNRWTLFFAPTYQYIGEESSTTEVLFSNSSTGISSTYTTGFSYFELPVGLRYSFKLGENFKSYVSVAYGFNAVISDNTQLQFSDNNNLVTPERIITENKNSSFVLGLGGQITNRFDIFLNYYIQKFITIDKTVQNDLSGSLSLGVAYKVF